MSLRFEDDDDGYREWLWSHLGGYVINAERGSNPGEPILHRATCDTITPTPDRSSTKGYIKVCAVKRFELDEWARGVNRRLKPCVFCDP